MLVFPNAKINLGLRITEKRMDGFHNLETVFYPIPLKDALEFVVKSEGDTQFTCQGIPLDSKPEQNLIMKAYHSLTKDFKLPNLDIFLYKNIPFGAGLGGGSADAAFMLSALNSEFELNLSKEKLKEYASKIGADCAFFIENSACYATQKGDVLENISLNLKNWFIVLVKPNVFVSTPIAYAGVVPQATDNYLPDLLAAPVSSWRGTVLNDFENTIFERFPEVGAIKEKLYAHGAIYAAMSGSGSAVFGLFENEVDLDNYFDGAYVWSAMF